MFGQEAVLKEKKTIEDKTMKSFKNRHLIVWEQGANKNRFL